MAPLTLFGLLWLVVDDVMCDVMGHNSLTSIAYARPIIYAEGLFASCYLHQGEFVPEEGISGDDLCNILSGELFNSGLDLVEDYAVRFFIMHCWQIVVNFN